MLQVSEHISGRQTETPRTLPTWLLPVGAAVFAVALLGYAVWAERHQPFLWRPLDLEVYQGGGRAIAHGDGRVYNGGFGYLNLPFTYPPFAALVFAVTSAIPFGLLKILMAAIDVATLPAVAWMALGKARVPADRGRLGAALLVGGLCLGSEPVQQTLAFGQVNLLLLLVVFADLQLKEHRWWKGIGIGLAAGFKLTPAIFIGYLVVTRRFRAAAVSIAAAVGTIGLSYLLRPSDAKQYWGHLVFDSSRIGGVEYAGNQSLHGFIARLWRAGPDRIDHTWLLTAVVVVVIAFLLSVRAQRKGDELLTISLAALGALLVSPISWSHHWVWIVPFLTWLGLRAWTIRTAPGWVAVVAVCGAFAAWPIRVAGAHGPVLPLGIIWALPNNNHAEYTWAGAAHIYGNLYVLIGLVGLFWAFGLLYAEQLRNLRLAVSRRIPSRARATGSVATTAAEQPTGPAETGEQAEPVKRLGRQPALDGIRGLAVLFVLIAHGGLLLYGNIGVDVFFALSGFLITNLLTEERLRTGAISFRNFYARRVRRLLPALVILIAGVAALDAAGVVFRYSWEGRPWSLPHQALTTLFFANNWVVGLLPHGGDKLGPFSPTWSLAVEEQFYFVWPLVLFLLLRFRVRAWARAALVAATAGALVLSVPYAAHAIGHYDLYYSPLDRFAELLFGCLAAFVWRYGPRVPALWSQVAGWAALAMLIGLLSGVWTLPMRLVFLGAAGLSATLVLAVLWSPDGLLTRALRFPPLRYLGTISYGLYLYQLPIDMTIKRYLSALAWPVNDWANFGILFVGTVVVASLSWHLVESRILAGRPKAAEPSPHPAEAARNLISI